MTEREDKAQWAKGFFLEKLRELLRWSEYMEAVAVGRVEGSCSMIVAWAIRIAIKATKTYIAEANNGKEE